MYIKPSSQTPFTHWQDGFDGFGHKEDTWTISLLLFGSSHSLHNTLSYIISAQCLPCLHHLALQMVMIVDFFYCLWTWLCYSTDAWIRVYQFIECLYNQVILLKVLVRWLILSRHCFEFGQTNQPHPKTQIKQTPSRNPNRTTHDKT